MATEKSAGKVADTILTWQERYEKLSERLNVPPNDLRAERRKSACRDAEIADLRAALARSQPGYRLVPVKITPAMIEAGIEAHYGKQRVAKAGGARGVSMTVNGTDYDGVEAMRNFWKGALSAAPDARSQPQGEPKLTEADPAWPAGEREAFRLGALSVQPQGEPVHFVKSIIHSAGWHECSADDSKWHAAHGIETRVLYTFPMEGK